MRWSVCIFCNELKVKRPHVSRHLFDVVFSLPGISVPTKAILALLSVSTTLFTLLILVAYYIRMPKRFF